MSAPTVTAILINKANEITSNHISTIASNTSTTIKNKDSFGTYFILTTIY